ncbi:MAG: hypothetical protein MR450_08455 [Prevotella sp.]|nr:hypothetical protein [Prevotella sp.]MDY4040252.1 hypothetical protein [Prevotella sp.]
MNKILRYVFVALLAVVSNMGFAQDAQPAVTLDFTTNDVWKFPTDYVKTARTFTYGTYTITLGASSNGYKWGTFGDTNAIIFGKSGATLTLPAFDFDVERIDIVGTSGASSKTTQNIFVDGNAVSTETTGAQGTHEYKIADASQKAGTIYTLKVTNAYNTQVSKILIWKKGTAPAPVSIKNTPDKAYTVAEAKGLFDAGEALSDSVYVKGIVSKVDISDFKKYNNLNIFISDDGKEETKNPFEAYACNDLGNKKFTAADAVQAGDEVIVYGKLTKFSSTYELAKGCYLYSINGKTTGISSVKASQKSSELYNLSGQRVNSSYKGVVIRNGKKFVNK